MQKRNKSYNIKKKQKQLEVIFKKNKRASQYDYAFQKF